MEDFQTTTGGKKGAKKDFKETPLPSVLDEQRTVNKKKKKDAATFLYGGAAKELGVADEPQPADTTAATTVDKEEEKKDEEKEEANESGEDDEESKRRAKDKHRLKMEQKKKGKGGNKRKKGGAESSEEEDAGAQEEEKVAPTATKKGPAKNSQTQELSPIEVAYCRICGIPPEYCMFDKKDSSECKEWLRQAHPQLFENIYEEAAVKPEGEAEEVKEDPNKKKKKKVSLAPCGDSVIKIYKAKRGGKKMICSVTGLQAYGVPLKDMAKLMSKKFSCGANVTDDEKYGECIQIQGDIQKNFMEFAEKELAKYKVNMEKIVFEEIKKKKKAEGATDEADGDEDDA